MLVRLAGATTVATSVSSGRRPRARRAVLESAVALTTLAQFASVAAAGAAAASFAAQGITTETLTSDAGFAAALQSTGTSLASLT